MILRVRSPFHAPRDVDLGPGWAAHGTGNGGGLRIGHMDGQVMGPAPVTNVGPRVFGERMCRSGHRLSGMNVSVAGDCLVCRRRRDHDRMEGRQRDPGLCANGHSRAENTGHEGRCLVCRRESERRRQERRRKERVPA